MNWRKWLYGLLSAAIGAAANSITVVIIDPLTFNIEAGLNNLFAVMAVSAIVAVGAYLKQSPLPCEPDKPILKDEVK